MKAKKERSRAEQIAYLMIKSRGFRLKADELLEDERNEIQRPKLRALVGKCFKYLNTYGGDCPKWWLYCRIISFDEKKMTYKTVQFQHTSREHIEIRHTLEFNFRGETRFGVESNWQFISDKEYLIALKQLTKTIGTLLGAE